MKIINLTQHAISLPDREIPPSGQIARIVTVEHNTETLDGIQTAEQNVGWIENLPPPADDTIYIVSLPLLHAACRSDVYAPDTGTGAIRDEAGRIVGTTRLVRLRICETCRARAATVTTHKQIQSECLACYRAHETRRIQEMDQSAFARANDARVRPPIEDDFGGATGYKKH